MDFFPNEMMRCKRWIRHLIFYRIPKNASTSLYHHLGDFNMIKKNEQLFKEKANFKLYRGLFDPTHAKPYEVYNIFRSQMKNFFSFCVVRNPWDRAISMYHFALKENLGKVYNIHEKLSFEDFCNLLKDHQDNPYFIATHKQVEWIQGDYGPEVILRFENLNIEFANMLKDYDISHISPNIPHKNSTNHKIYTEYYNDKSKKIIANVFEKDIDTLKYTF